MAVGLHPYTPLRQLAVPDDDSRDDEDPLHYGDVLLFVERKRASALNVCTDARVLACIAELSAPRRHPDGNRACGPARHGH